MSLNTTLIVKTYFLCINYHPTSQTNVSLSHGENFKAFNVLLFTCCGHSWQLQSTFTTMALKCSTRLFL